MEPRLIGDLEVSAIALGGASWSIYETDPQLVERTIDAALDAGVTMIDTAYVYTTRDELCHNERLIARLLAARGREDVVVATKGGHYRGGDDFPFDGRPETVVRHCEESLSALGVDCIELYQLHGPDTEVPLAETMGAFAELKSAGKIKRVGVSNVNSDQLRLAREVVQIDSVQNHLSPWAGEAAFRRAGANPVEAVDVLGTCSAEGIAFLDYAPLTGPAGADGDGRTRVPAIASVANERGVSQQQVILAWALAQGPTVVPVVGANRPQSILDSLAAASLRLSAEELDLISALHWRK